MKATEQYFYVMLVFYIFLSRDLPNLCFVVCRVKGKVTYRVKLGYMVERRSIIFSKLLEGLALSAAGAAEGAGAAVVAAAAAARPASEDLSPLTAAVPPSGGALALAAPADALGRGGSDALGARVLFSAVGWAWFCWCPGTW